MRKVICDRCMCEVTGPAITDKFGCELNRTVSIPRVFNDNNGHGTDLCYECLYDMLQFEVRNRRPVANP